MYVFRLNESLWSYEAKLIPESAVGRDYVGMNHMMDVKNNVLVLGDSQYDSSRGTLGKWV